MKASRSAKSSKTKSKAAAKPKGAARAKAPARPSRPAPKPQAKAPAKPAKPSKGPAKPAAKPAAKAPAPPAPPAKAAAGAKGGAVAPAPAAPAEGAKAVTPRPLTPKPAGGKKSSRKGGSSLRRGFDANRPPGELLLPGGPKTPEEILYLLRGSVAAERAAGEAGIEEVVLKLQASVADPDALRTEL
ncbi:MAG TPA: hypothetical protein VF310_05545, partial [Vicinamibacteria bacterium]